jgi:hypothetical protein
MERYEILGKEVFPLLHEASTKLEKCGFQLVIAIWDSENDTVIAEQYSVDAFKHPRAPITPLLTIISSLWSLLLATGHAPVDRHFGDIISTSGVKEQFQRHNMSVKYPLP